MAKVLGILTALILALSASIAYKNKAKFEDEKVRAATARTELDNYQKRQAAQAEGVDKVPEKRAAADAEVARLTAEQTALQAKTAELNAAKEAKSATNISNKNKIEEAKKQTSSVGDLPTLAAKMKSASLEIEELSQTISSSEATLAQLTATSQAASAKANAARSELEMLTQGKSLPTLSTRVRAFYPTWGFVTLAAGNNAGVVGGSQLNVVRDGQVIAKLLVTSVEATRASASIVPDSVSPDTVIRSGDRVTSSN